MNQTVNKIGLTERLRQAANEEELARLRAEGTRYDMASPATVRRWDRAVAIRLAELNRGQAESNKKPAKKKKTRE